MQAGNANPLFSPFRGQTWATNPMMASENAYQQAAHMSVTLGQGGHQGYGTAGDALVQAGASGSDTPSGDLTSSSNALVQFPGIPFADNTASTPMATDGVIKIGNVS